MKGLKGGKQQKWIKTMLLFLCFLAFWRNSCSVFINQWDQSDKYVIEQRRLMGFITSSSFVTMDEVDT